MIVIRPNKVSFIQRVLLTHFLVFIFWYKFRIFLPASTARSIGGSYPRVVILFYTIIECQGFFPEKPALWHSNLGLSIEM